MMNDDKDFLQHYASKYYDPVKAHEYYMRTRELKGRRSASKLSDEGKKIWSYTKQEIKNEKKEEVQEEQENRDEKIAELRSKAAETRQAISDKLKALKEALAEKAASKKEDISEKRNAAIERLMDEEIPKSLPKEQRAKLIAERNEKIAKLRSDAKEDKASVTEETKTTREEYSENARTEREEVATKLKSAITAAREAYKVAKSSLDASYENIYQTEFDKILSEYAKKKKK